MFPDSSWFFINLANANEVSKTSTKHSKATLLTLCKGTFALLINRKMTLQDWRFSQKPFKNKVLFQPRFLHSKFVSHYQLSNLSFASFIMEIQSFLQYFQGKNAQTISAKPWEFYLKKKGFVIGLGKPNNQKMDLANQIVSVESSHQKRSS